MKKLILPTIVLTSVIFLVLFFSYKVSAQDQETIGCEELREIRGSEECPHYVLDNGGLWCSLTVDELTPEETAQGLKFPYRNRPPDYTMDHSSDYWSEDIERGMKCLGGEAEQENSTQPGQLQSDQTGKQKKQSKDGNPLSVFEFNPLETWRNIQGLLNIPEGLKSLVQTAEILSGPAEIKIRIPEPAISLDPEGKHWDFLPGYIPHESIKPGSTITATKLSTFQTGPAVIQLRPNDNQEGSMYIGTHPFLRSGEAEIIVEPQNGQQFELQTPNAEIFVIGTKFLVAYNPKEDQTLVAVYEGKVEVKTKDGKTAAISPIGDNPGVVLVTQKLSVIKLAVVGFVVVGIIAGIIWTFKRKFSKKK